MSGLDARRFVPALRTSGRLLACMLLAAGLSVAVTLAGSPPSAHAGSSHSLASGWVIGTPPNAGYGVILHSVDDGMTWTRQGSSADVPETEINNVKAVDANTAWVVGSADATGGVVLRTTDAGTTWTRVGDGEHRLPQQDIYGVAPVNADTAWVSGTNGAILHTTDGGKTWAAQSSGTTANLVEIAAADSKNAWAAGGFEAGVGVIVHTSDGGQTWHRQAVAAADRPLIDLSVVDARTAWAVGSHGLVLKTTDAGAHWVAQMKYNTPDNNGVCAVNGTAAWIAADYDTVFHTTNGGTAWKEQNATTGGYYLLGTCALGPNMTWVVGGTASFPPDRGVVLHTTNSGTSWSTASIPLSVTFRRIAMVRPAPPAAPTSARFATVPGGTRITWPLSSGATGYLVYSGSTLLGEVGPTTTQLLVHKLLGPRAAVTVVAQDVYGGRSAPVRGVYVSGAWVKIGSVRFAGNSSRLSASAKRTLRSLASQMRAQGFTYLHVNGYTAVRDVHLASNRARISLARAKSVRSYLIARLRLLHASATIHTAGLGGVNPVASNATAAGAAKNRRAEIILGPSARGIDYSQAGNWLARPTKAPHAVDVFYVYPTSYSRLTTGSPDIGPIDAANMVAGARRNYARQATAFVPLANVFAPWYQQVDAMYQLSLPMDQQNDIIAGVPGTEVTAAFDYYIKHQNHGRPLILAGHSQGSAVLKYLLSHYMKTHPSVYKRMIAAYVVGQSIAPAYLAQSPYLKYATGPSDTGVVISWNTEATSIAATSPITEPGGIAINPITWTLDETTATAAQNLGSLAIDPSTQYPLLDASCNPQAVMNLADARVDHARGVVVCSSVDPAIYSAGIPGVYHSNDYPFYFFNVRANAAERIASYLASH